MSIGSIKDFPFDQQHIAEVQIISGYSFQLSSVIVAETTSVGYNSRSYIL